MATLNYQAPAKVELENKSDKTIKVSISGVNQSFGIAPGDKVQLTAQTSSEIIGYISQDVDGVLEVTVTPAAAQA